jgi:hypothetical protein
MNIDLFIKAAAEIDVDQAELIEDSFFRLTYLMRANEVSVGRKLSSLKQINTYIQKKCSELDPTLTEARESSLRKVRNELAHGKIRRDIDLKPLYPELWKAIGRLGTRLGASEIENLLAYTLDVPNVNASARGATANKVVQIYRPMFNALPDELQRIQFAELLLRLFTDTDSLSLLEPRIRK